MSKLNEISLENFLEFAKEANTRSTLAVEDGLKPVHRRILYSMGEQKILSNKTHVKSAKVVGEVLGSYHPHGDSSVYDAAVRLSQDFKMRYPLVDMYGNNGSISDPDSYAASRYTSIRLSPIGEYMLGEINPETVDMVENYSGDLLEPVVLPSVIPNALINGGMGIGVGVSSSLVPHNLNEVVDAILAYIANKHITTNELMQYIQGPDFPGGGVIVDAFSLPNIYDIGKGVIKLRAKHRFETVAGRPHIVITEVPYLTSIENKIIKPIQNLIREEEYQPIFEIQNSSGKHGIELRIILEKNANPYAVLQTLFEKTGLESSVKINQTVMLKDGNFATLSLRGLILQYLKYQHNIMIKNATYHLRKSEARLHIVEGLIIAANNIDEVVQIIKKSKDIADSRKQLISRFKLSTDQAQAILDMKLARLNSLEINKLVNEEKSLIDRIADLKEVISSEGRRELDIKQMLKTLKAKFGDERRTLITENTIAEKGERILIYTNEENQVRSIKQDVIEQSAFGKVGKKAINDKPIIMIDANTKDDLWIVDTTGRLIPTTVKELLSETATLEFPIAAFVKPEEKDYIVVVTKNGIVKKTSLPKIKRSIIITKVKDDDAIVKVFLANDNDYLMVLSDSGKCANIQVSEFTTQNRNTFGGKGVTMNVADAALANSESLILTVNNDNKAKITKHEDFVVNAKGSSGATITEGTKFISIVDLNSLITIFSVDGKALSIQADRLSIKSRTSLGTTIYKAKIQNIICS